MPETKNIDEKTVAGFGDEWTRLRQDALDSRESHELFEQYFKIFPWGALPPGAEGFDLGCGSGRWAKVAAARVGRLHCIDASAPALAVARRNLAGQDNCKFHLASVDDIPLEECSMDFGYCLGVLHHVPDTAAGIKACAAKLKAGAPLLLYLYYDFDNRPAWFRWLWRSSDLLRRIICRLPYAARFAVTQVLAALVYFPLARISLGLEGLGFDVEMMPLSLYRRRSFYTMRTDALDRFGTRLEKRFSARSSRRMMEEAGLGRIVFSDSVPYWCAVGYRK